MNLDNHPKRGVLKDIDKTTLLRMREDGLSNREIADQIGCSYATIVKILGKQPKGMRHFKPRTDVIEPKENIGKSHDCRIHDVIKIVQGVAGQYEVNIINGTVRLLSDNVHIDMLSDLVGDLVAIGNMREVKSREM